MLTVLHILDSMNRGGIESFIMNLYRSIDRTKVRFVFLLQNKSNSHRQEIEELGGQIYTIPARRNSIIEYHRNLNDFFKKNAKDISVVHQHASSLSCIDPLFYAKKYGIKIRILHSHNTSISASKLHYLLHWFNKFRVKPLATHYFACSELAKEWMFNYTGVEGKVIVVNNGIILENFAFDENVRNAKRNELGLEKDNLVVGHIGNISKVKNQIFLVDILKALVNKSDRYRLMLIGDGVGRKALLDKINDLNLNQYVLFLGLRDDTNELLQAMDCFVFPSLFEGLPVALVEAQTAGLLVVESDSISIMSKLLETTILLPLDKGDFYWANIINEKLRSFIRVNVRNIIQSKGFDMTNIAEKLLSIYGQRD
ncbi:Glycosyltransferase involved in cell wall bisynthesis [Bacteroides luti]|uniref:Glycosyltransferase involved in cell wall bisynthesis n=1 Tax=Bacteroides luti TaxID=1297750 RepID=A0A1M4WIY5_9BACE|nr:glycosyltransferase [Bacteroides luti]SHE81186.1 Glycosyltransferase involved in cell wall bisynthesis [Bacteroides luti]